MVILKTSREIAAMREAGRISSRALQEAGKAVEPGVSTLEAGCGTLVSRIRRLSCKCLYFGK